MYWWCGSSCLEMDNVTIAVVLLRLPGNCHCSLTHVSVSILVCSQPLFLCVCCFPNGLMDLTSYFRCPFIGLSLETDNVSATVDCHCSRTHVSVSILVCSPIPLYVVLFFKWSDRLDILILDVPSLVSHWKQTMSLQL